MPTTVCRARTSRYLLRQAMRVRVLARRRPLQHHLRRGCSECYWMDLGELYHAECRGTCSDPTQYNVFNVTFDFEFAFNTNATDESLAICNAHFGTSNVTAVSLNTASTPCTSRCSRSWPPTRTRRYTTSPNLRTRHCKMDRRASSASMMSTRPTQSASRRMSLSRPPRTTDGRWTSWSLRAGQARKPVHV